MPLFAIIATMNNLQAIIHKCRAPETGYWAEVPSLPGCVTQGETLEEVKAMLSDAVSGWLQAAKVGTLKCIARQAGIPEEEF